MLRFLCCAFCALLLLASPAFGLDIYEDFVMDESNAPTSGGIAVHGNAKLTITGNPNRVRQIYMYDTSSLLVEGGWLRGDVRCTVRMKWCLRVAGWTARRTLRG
jgi:hypothetical protein